MVCANCGEELKDSYIKVGDNFLQAKYFDSEEDNRFCSSECLAESLSCIDVPVDNGEEEEGGENAPVTLRELLVHFGTDYADVPIYFDLNGEGAVPARGAILNEEFGEDGAKRFIFTNIENGYTKNNRRIKL